MINVKTMNSIIIALMVMVTLSGTTTNVDAREFRSIKFIYSPSIKNGNNVNNIKFNSGFIGYEALELGLQPIPREAIFKAVHDFFNAWNAGNLDSFIAPEFVNKDKLLDAIDDTVPRDATIRVQAISSAATLPNDRIEWQDDNTWFIRKSTVIVTASTQIEFTTATGFQRITGNNEYTFDVSEEYR